MKRWIVGLVLASLCAVGLSNAQIVSQVVHSIVATTCTNQLIRSIAGTGAGTCATVVNADLATMTDSTIKGRAVGAGTGTPTDLTAAQAAAVIGSVGGALRSKKITITRDMTAATGSVAYTGMGFTPSSCIATGSVGSSLTQYVSIFGLMDSAGSAAVVTLTSSVLAHSTAFIYLGDSTGAAAQSAGLASYDADGFTLNWTKTGSPAGTATIHVMCFR